MLAAFLVSPFFGQPKPVQRYKKYHKVGLVVSKNRKTIVQFWPKQLSIVFVLGLFLLRYKGRQNGIVWVCLIFVSLKKQFWVFGKKGKPTPLSGSALFNHFKKPRTTIKKGRQVAHFVQSTSITF